MVDGAPSEHLVIVIFVDQQDEPPTMQPLHNCIQEECFQLLPNQLSGMVHDPLQRYLPCMHYLTKLPAGFPPRLSAETIGSGAASLGMLPAHCAKLSEPMQSKLPRYTPPSRYHRHLQHHRYTQNHPSKDGDTYNVG
jgi:hypothetical protein